MLIPRLLVGPLLDPEQIGDWIHHPQIRSLADPRVFQPPPAWQGIIPPPEVDSPPWLPYRYGESLKDLLYRLGDWQPEVILWWGFGYTVLPPDLHQAPCPVVLIASDWQTCLSELWAWREAFDLILGDQALVNQFQARNFARCAWWPSYGFSPRQFYPDPQAPKIWDLTYIGSLNPDTHRERLHLLSQLAPLGCDFRVCFRDRVFAADYRQLLQQSRLVFNHALRGEMNLRAYQAPACGALLVQEAHNLEIARFLEPGRECLLYHPETVAADLRSHLARTDLPALAQAGHNAIQAHTYHAQFEKLLANLPQYLDSNSRSQHAPWPAPSQSLRQLKQALHPAMTAGQSESLKQNYLGPDSRLPAEWQSYLALSLKPCFGARTKPHPALNALLHAAEHRPADPFLQHNRAWGGYLAGAPAQQVIHWANQALAQLETAPLQEHSSEPMSVLPWLGSESFQLAWEAAFFAGKPESIRALLCWNLWRLKAEVAWRVRDFPAALEAFEQALRLEGPPTLWFPYAQVAAALNLKQTAWQALEQHGVIYPLDRRGWHLGLSWALAQRQNIRAKGILQRLECLSWVLVTDKSERERLAVLKKAL